MKKLLSLLASLGLITSSSTLAVSCKIDDNEKPPVEPKYGDCFDQYGNNVTDKNSDGKQLSDMSLVGLHLLILSKEIFTKSSDFYDKMNNKSASDLLKECFRDANGEEIPTDGWWNFYYNFNFLIMNTESLNFEGLEKIKEEIQNKNAGTYLILNLPNIKNLENIQNEPKIEFEFLFLIKEENGRIIGNQKNNWFYWLNIQFKNNPSENSLWFFNPINDDENKFTFRVITDVSPQLN